MSNKLHLSLTDRTSNENIEVTFQKVECKLELLMIVTIMTVQAVHVLDECILPFACGRELQMHAET